MIYVYISTNSRVGSQQPTIVNKNAFYIQWHGHFTRPQLILTRPWLNMGWLANVIIQWPGGGGGGGLQIYKALVAVVNHIYLITNWKQRLHQLCSNEKSRNMVHYSCMCEFGSCLWDCGSHAFFSCGFKRYLYLYSSELLYRQQKIPWICQCREVTLDYLVTGHSAIYYTGVAWFLWYTKPR